MMSLPQILKSTCLAFLVVLAGAMVTEPVTAKGPGGKVTVTAAEPGEAEQGVELDVLISGEGFDAGSTAAFLVGGSNDASQIEVLSNEFQSASGQLKTRIRVKDAAVVADYDIQVTNSRGRRGKGTTLFRVKLSNASDDNAGSGNGGDPEPVYLADDGEGGLIDGDPIESTNLSFDQIIFRPDANFTFDLSGFPVSGPGACPSSEGAYFPADQVGTLVLSPGDSASTSCAGGETSAQLRLGFQGALGDGKVVQHYLDMQGCMAGPWPPTFGTTLMTLTSWSIEAENRKAKRSDCEGAGETSYVIGVSLAPGSP